MSTVETRRLSVLETRIAYIFKDKAVALRALTHASYGDGRRKHNDNERLEFLGDRILGLMTAHRLYELSSGDEGAMARKLNALVRKETCATIAREIGLGDALMMSPSEERQGGRDKTSILGDACEAVIAALYLDGGFEAAWDFYDKFWIEELKRVTQKSMKDPKTELQERASAAGVGAPQYNVVERSGPDHRPNFIIEVECENIGSAQGAGKSKKRAERIAARHLLENWPV